MVSCSEAEQASTMTPETKNTLCLVILSYVATFKGWFVYLHIWCGDSSFFTLILFPFRLVNENIGVSCLFFLSSFTFFTVSSSRQDFTRTHVERPTAHKASSQSDTGLHFLLIHKDSTRHFVHHNIIPMTRKCNHDLFTYTSFRLFSNMTSNKTLFSVHFLWERNSAASLY